jgi:hypothetical protein
VFGDQTRVIIEHADAVLQVYYILDIRNSARAPVNPPSAVVVNMPSGAASATVLSGAPQAVALGDHVSITGPFASGQTKCRSPFKCPSRAPMSRSSRSFPLAVPGLAVLMKKTGDISMSRRSSQHSGARVRKGAIYPRAGTDAAGGCSAGRDGLRAAAPQRLAAANCADAGHPDARRRVLDGGRRPTPGSERGEVKQLSGKREKIYAELVRLEQQRRAGGIDAAKYAERRPALMAQLERVYRDLDTEGGHSAVA